jgi:hypothetical protein
MSIYHFRENNPSQAEQRLNASHHFAEQINKSLEPRRKREMMEFESGLRREELAEKNKLEELSLPDYETVKEQFGETFAKLYKSAPTGGKTELLKAGLDSLLRGEKVSDLLGGGGAPDQIPEIPEMMMNEMGDMNESGVTEVPPKFEIPDYTKRPKGYTPKEWADERKEWRKTNTTIFDTLNTRIKGNERDILGTQKLNNLNETGKLPKDFGKLIINPSTGDIRGVAQLAEIPNRETQEWVKEIARFGNRAKDAFGSRVTNFDLFQYMKQFPSLLNSEEGRRGILKMMKINYKLDNLYDKALQKIYHDKGLAGIPPEQADRIARQQVAKETEKLRKEYLTLDEENISSFQKEGISQPHEHKADKFFGHLFNE